MLYAQEVPALRGLPLVDTEFCQRGGGMGGPESDESRRADRCARRPLRQTHTPIASSGGPVTCSGGTIAPSGTAIQDYDLPQRRLMHSTTIDSGSGRQKVES